MNRMDRPKVRKMVAPEVLYESLASLVLSKPAGLPVIPGRSPEDQDCLRNWAQKRFPDSRILVVHRIDKPASGAVLFARTPEAHRAYSMAFERGEMDKRYLAVVDGEACPESGELWAFLPSGGPSLDRLSPSDTGPSQGNRPSSGRGPSLRSPGFALSLESQGKGEIQIEGRAGKADPGPAVPPRSFDPVCGGSVR